MVISIALVSAATMAWFTDSDDAGQATFEAGTVSIEAGRKIIIDGDGSGGEDSAIYKEVMPLRVVSVSQGKAGINNNLNVKPSRSHKSAVLDLEEGKDDSNFYSLGFGGEMILEFDHALYKPDVAIVVEDTWGGNYPEETAEIFVSTDGENFVLIGTATNKNLKNNQTYSNFELSDMNLDIDYIKYVKVVDTTDVQPFIDSGKYKANENTVDGFDLNTVILGGYIVEEEIWNPGDTNYSSYTIINTGSKRINLRGKLSGSWYKYDEDDSGGKWVPDTDLSNNNVTITPASSSNWTDGDDGYLYYETDIPGTYGGESTEIQRTAELEVEVHLIGFETNNLYQGKRYMLSAEFEAIQASNNAPQEKWGVDIYNDVQK